MLACIACGRVGFAGQDGSVSGDTAIVADTAIALDSSACATATFTNPPASSLTDNFAAGPLTDLWSPIAPCIQQTAGELVAVPSATGSYCHAWTNASYHLTCDSVTFEVAEATAQVNGAQTFVYIEQAGNPAIYTDLLLENDFMFAAASLTDGVHMGLYDSVQDRWWRLQEANGELRLLTSPDGVAWTLRGSTPDPMPLDNVQIAIGAGTWQAVAAPGQARFHCYNVPPPCN